MKRTVNGLYPATAGTLTYDGDVTHMVEERQWVGPNMLGEVMEAVRATYDTATRKTRVGFRYVSKDEIALRLAEQQ